MELNKRNVILLLVIILLAIFFAFLWNENKERKFYKSELFGIVKEIRSNRKFENSKVVKFDGDKDFNYLFWFYAPNSGDLKKGDSIYKPQKSYEYQIYRKNDLGTYKFYNTLKNKP